LYHLTSPLVNLLLSDLIWATGYVTSPLVARSIIDALVLRLLSRPSFTSTCKCFLPTEVTNTPYFTGEWHWATSISSDYFFCWFYNLCSSWNQHEATRGEILVQIQNSVDFVYTPIVGKDTIRLLLIYPRPLEGPLKCALFSVPLSSMPCYKAISYCWGSKEKNFKIIVNDRSLKVTSNALRVLKNRSSLWAPRLVWINTVCINQDDHDEKSSQISLMTDIYGKASVVSIELLADPNEEDIKAELQKSLKGLGQWARFVDDGQNHFKAATPKHVVAFLAADVLQELVLRYWRGDTNSSSKLYCELGS
jgi:hypothetical protein